MMTSEKNMYYQMLQYPDFFCIGVLGWEKAIGTDSGFGQPNTWNRAG